ncbi:hypothetical protein AZI87_16595 [Bdellovibrio bacteriovorus]|uniref:Uncharacterized protein n=1 Tax=Bdellovibrio bacteriovorus TaxID=959 RepID=A0A162FZR1_BDEBC|nr:hypothetical protein [Bdellovibrio bacteriovorus]KYG62885.1 hypothetical protein AZI87_16595 [Bdellovibrio bacteriovorus]
MEVFSAPFEILSHYNRIVKENYNGIYPRSEKFCFIALPIIMSFCVALMSHGNISTATSENLLTIHGIFLSVLVASYAPFLDFLKPGATITAKATAEVSDQEYLSTEYVLSKAGGTVRKLLFISNSLCIVLSLGIIVLLCIQPIVCSDLIPWFFDIGYMKGQPVISFIYSWTVYGLVITNGYVLLRIVAIMANKILTEMD